MPKSRDGVASAASGGSKTGGAIESVDSDTVPAGVSAGVRGGAAVAGIGSKISHLEHAFINESPCSFGKHVVTAPTVTPASPSSPPTIKHMKAVADELFDKVALSSTSSKDDYSNNVEGYVVDDPE
eukprot:scaffold74187_cov37-Attheya_sp.AAC.2